ncbi:MAG: PIN domain-containing protein [Anaerolineae bacterium]|nr:PIN domain-containing protein [Thermoflexales bacterium]MDW8395216.1 PIN domain-containing protein [Anaerolineae bacterium]
MSFQTAAELYFWAYRNQWGQQRFDELKRALDRFVTLFPDEETGRLWGEIRHQRMKQGRAISPQDAWAAACAVRHSAPLVTNNASDFSGISGLHLLP